MRWSVCVCESESEAERCIISSKDIRALCLVRLKTYGRGWRNIK